MSNIVEHFESLRLADLKLSSQVTVSPGSPVRAAVRAMAAQEMSCVVVVEGRDPVGIMTEHDVTTTLVGAADLWDGPISVVMTPDPIVISHTASAMDALRTMTERGIRNLPVVDDAGDVLGNITNYDMIRYASNHLRNQPDIAGQLEPEHNLLFVDFTGLEARPPVLVRTDTSLADTIDAMVGAGTGLATVVDERDLAVGEFTEHDVFTKVVLRVHDLTDEVVGQWMTTPIAAAPPDTPISEGLHLMADLGHRYLVLLNETGRALGVLTFSDIAAYLDAIFATETAAV